MTTASPTVSNAWMLPRYVLGAAVVAACLVALVLSNGNFFFAVAPLGALLVVWVVLNVPVRTTALIFLTLMLSISGPNETPHPDWVAPGKVIGDFLYKRLNVLTGIQALRLQGAHLVVLVLCALFIYRRAVGKSKDFPAESAKILTPFWFLMLGGLGYGYVRGLTAGGNMGESLWQVHLLVFTPIIYYLFSSTLRGTKDFKTLGRIIVFASCVKAVVAAMFIYGFCAPRGLHPEYATSHSDTMNYAAAVAILVVPLFEKPTRRKLIQLLPIIAIVMTGMILNDRRLVWVSIAGTMVFAVLMLRRHAPLKRWMHRWTLPLIPILAAYVAVGWNIRNPLFKPVEVVKGMVVGDQAVGDAKASTEYRDIENWNIYQTWMKSPVMGNGYGTIFDMVIQMPDISGAMPNWRYHPHNQMLWLWSNVGLVGWVMIWNVLVVAAYLGARAYRRATEVRQKVGAVVCIAAIISYMNQAYGDMGLITWYSALYAGGAVAVLGQLAVETGAWPSRRKRKEQAIELGAPGERGDADARTAGVAAPGALGAG